MIGFEEISKVASVLKEAGKIEEYAKILELQQQLLEMQNNIQKLTKENSDLKEKFEIKNKLIYRNNTYYNGEDGPFCSRCWDKNKDLIRVIPNWVLGNHATCPECRININYTGIEDKAIQNNEYEDDSVW